MLASFSSSIRPGSEIIANQNKKRKNLMKFIKENGPVTFEVVNLDMDQTTFRFYEVIQTFFDEFATFAKRIDRHA